MTTRPHLKYRGIKDEAKAAAEELFAARPWRLENDGDKVAVAQVFADSISTLYGVPSPQIQISSRVYMAYAYRPAIRTALDEEVTRGVITLRHWSILQLFKAVREHVNYCKNQRIDEFQWACSLFYAVRPTMFRKRVREGRVSGVTVRALYTTETWEQMKAEGLVDEYDRLIDPNAPSDEEDDATAHALDLAIEDDVIDMAEHGISQAQSFLSETVYANEADAADARADAAFGVDWDEDDEDEDESDDDDEPTVAEQVAAETDEAFRNDGLDNLGIVALRRLGSGQSIPGMWNLDKPGLIAALRAKGIRG